MMSLRYKSFCCGIIVTSFTWCVILYLHSSISSSHPSSDIKPKTKLRPRHEFEFLKDKYVELDHNYVKNSYKRNAVRSSDFNNIVKNAKVSKHTKYHVVPSDDISYDPEDISMIGSPDDQKVHDYGSRHYAFNLLVSNRLSLHRTFNDPRHYLCKQQTYQISELPSASVIICFYNEALSTLLRTVTSVIDRTPHQLLHEIILVDDSSDDSDMIDALKDYLGELNFVKIKFFQTAAREGLIRARIFGARKAKGQVLVFLDSHCEVSATWLEPLLERIATNESNVVCPIIDMIDADTFEYSPSPLVRGGFNWGLHFKWDSVPRSLLQTKADFIKPIRSPTMAGGLFAINRLYFKHLGEYDEGMNIWGGENLEISFRIWMCGGSLEIIPCSHVGHVFRRRRPYGSPDGQDTMSYNSLRVARVWLNHYKEYYFQIRKDLRDRPSGDISSRLKLKKTLNCQSFGWYLKNIYPELKPPESSNSKNRLKKVKKKKSKKQQLKERIVQKSAGWRKRMPVIVKKYQLQRIGTNLCIQSEEEITSKGSLFILLPCSKSRRQMWYETTKKELLLGEILCLDASKQYPRLAKCHEQGGTQHWRITTKTDGAFQLYNPAAGKCLGTQKDSSGTYITTIICSNLQSSLWQQILH